MAKLSKNRNKKKERKKRLKMSGADTPLTINHHDIVYSVGDAQIKGYDEIRNIKVSKVRGRFDANIPISDEFTRTKEAYNSALDALNKEGAKQKDDSKPKKLKYPDMHTRVLEDIIEGNLTVGPDNFSIHANDLKSEMSLVKIKDYIDTMSAGNISKSNEIAQKAIDIINTRNKRDGLVENKWVSYNDRSPFEKQHMTPAWSDGTPTKNETTYEFTVDLDSNNPEEHGNFTCTTRFLDHSDELVSKPSEVELSYKEMLQDMADEVVVKEDMVEEEPYRSEGYCEDIWEDE